MEDFSTAKESAPPNLTGNPEIEFPSPGCLSIKNFSEFPDMGKAGTSEEAPAYEKEKDLKKVFGLCASITIQSFCVNYVK